MLKTVEAAFAEKDYQGALKILEAKESEISPALWHYNVGTINAQLGNFPLARYHLLQAEADGLSTKEAVNNRELVESKLEIEKYESPQGWSDYVYRGGVEASQGLFTTVSLLILILAIFSLWTKKSLKVFAAILLAGFFIMGINWWIHTWNKSVVLTTQPIHEGPSQIFEAREELPTGVLVITREKDGWLEILYPSRFEGWIKATGLKELK